MKFIGGTNEIHSLASQVFPQFRGMSIVNILGSFWWTQQYATKHKQEGPQTPVVFNEHAIGHSITVTVVVVRRSIAHLPAIPMTLTLTVPIPGTLGCIGGVCG